MGTRHSNSAASLWSGYGLVYGGVRSHDRVADAVSNIMATLSA
jgi:hypothetical protein